MYQSLIRFRLYLLNCPRALCLLCSELLGTDNAIQLPISVVWRAGDAITGCFDMIESSSVCVCPTSFYHILVFVHTLKWSATFE